MNLFDGAQPLLSAIVTFGMTRGAALPAPVAAKFAIASANGSAVDTICQTAESLYASLSQISDASALADARTLIGQCAAFASQFGWHNMGGARGAGILFAMQRDLGEAPAAGTSWPDPENDPSPLFMWGTPLAQTIPS